MWNDTNGRGHTCLSMLLYACMGFMLVGFVGIGGIFFYQNNLDHSEASDRTAPQPLPEITIGESVRVTPKPTFTPFPTATMSDTDLAAEEDDQTGEEQPSLVTATPQPDDPAQSEPVTFLVHADQILLREGPGRGHEAIARARQDARLPVEGRTPNGIWWAVCCLDSEPVWLELNEDVRLASGDIGAVAIKDVAILHAPLAPPTPDAPPGALANRSNEGRRIVLTPTPTPVPLPGNPACAIKNATYDSIPIVGEPSKIAQKDNPEVNLAVRGWSPSPTKDLMLLDYEGATDPHAPQLYTLFGDQRTPAFTSAHRVNEWDYNCNCPGAPIKFPSATLVGLATKPNEVLHVPDRSNGDIGQGYRVMVLYATENRITLKYTREDNILQGYALHIEGICVDPHLISLYNKLDRAGRQLLPVLNGLQPVGLAAGNEIRVAIRDTGSFMDPRARKDWWAGRR